MNIFLSTSCPILPPNAWIFHKSDYHLANAIDHIAWGGVYDEASNLACLITLQTGSNQLVSLPKTPSAGFQLFDNVPENTISELLQYIQNEFKVPLIVRQLPSLYNVKFGLDLHETLHKYFTNRSTEINHHVSLQNISLGNFHLMHQRNIKKCISDGFTFQMEPMSIWEQVYDFIATCRQQQSLEVNIAKVHFGQLITTLSDHYTIYSIRDAMGSICACTVVLKVNAAIVYNFLPAFDRGMTNHSPMAFLHWGLYGALRLQGFEFLDLGISSIDGHPQQGLITFKEKIGGQRNSRFVFSQNA